MRSVAAAVMVLVFLQACAGNPDRRTLAELRRVEPDLREVAVGDSLDKALEGYRRFLEETPTSGKTPEAMRRLADLQIEKRYGIIGGPGALPAPGISDQASGPAAAPRVDNSNIADLSEDEAAFEARATGDLLLPTAGGQDPVPGNPSPRQAIETYQRILEEYPHYERNDQVLYQMARAYDELGEPDKAMAVMDRLIREHGRSEYSDEVFFRRAEYYFVRRQYLDAEEAYAAVIAMGEHSKFYELALYKLGWSFYKQELYEEALHQYMALLDHKVSLGYDLAGQQESGAGIGAEEADEPDREQETATGDVATRAAEDEEERRIADTFRVISLAFSNLGGPDVLNDYFSKNGNRRYEHRIYSNLGEFYLTKLRYHDAATVYRSFTELNPFHGITPIFSMRVVEIYAEGGFAQLVVEAKQDYARRYALDAEYWMYFETAESPDVLAFLKTNLGDLASHYHSLYQDESLEEDRPEHYTQALHWYREYLSSFPEDEETPGVHYQLADLLFEHEDFQGAALAYESTAYDYPGHERSAAAGYAAIFAHRQYLKVVPESGLVEARLATVESSLKFADTFADHQHAAAVLGAAADDLYDMDDFQRALAAARQLIRRYPDAGDPLKRSAWSVIAHSSMDLEAFADAELAYGEVLALTAEDDDRKPALYDNLAAAIYKQGEAASELNDHRLAADHFLRISTAAPSSTIRPAAEYDAATSLMKLENWAAAAEVFRGFREAHPGHELQGEVTKQLAFVYREAGDLSEAAAEYERVADGAEDPELRRESLLMAGDLYDDAEEDTRALDVFSRYVEEYPSPVDLALEIRYRMAGMHQAAGSLGLYHDELRRIVDIDADAGVEGTPRTRYLAGKSALVLAETLYEQFDELALTLPFEASLAEKKKRMDAALSAFEALVHYQVSEVTTAATYYMAEIYGHFGTALLESERPTDLDVAELGEYELAIEAEAFPFEERAIDVHEKNLELMVAGTFDDWVQRSLDRLAKLMPGRYAKAEISTGFMGPVEVFSYRSPGADAISGDASDVSQLNSEVREAQDVSAVF